MIIARHQNFSDYIPQVAPRQLRHVRTQIVGIVQWGLVALAMFSVSAVAGVVAGVVVGVLG